MNDRYIKDSFTKTFRQVQPKFSQVCAAHLNKVKLNLPQYTLLGLLLDSGTMPMSEVGSKLHISKPAVTNLVDRLEKNGYLKRVPHPSDRRVYLLQILAKGEKAVRDMQAIILRILLKTLGSFGPNQKVVIMQFYSELSRNLDSIWQIKKASQS